MKLVKITPEYYEDVRRLRNDKRVQAGFVHNKFITPRAQIKYMCKYRNCYYVCLCEEKFAGYIGVIDGDIRVCVKPRFQRRGIGLFMVRKIKKLYPNAHARIKTNNVSSLYLFMKAGFKMEYFFLTQ